MGLSYPALSDQTKPFFDRIISQKVLPHNVFAVYLSRDKSKDHSKFFLGGFDHNFVKGKIIYHRVVRKTWWTLSLDKVLLNGADTGLCNPQTKCEIIMDTGASLMATPPKMYPKFLSMISKMGSCKNYKKFPKITFVIDGHSYTLNSDEYLLDSANSIEYKQKQDGICSIGFSIFDVGPLNVWIAGDIFLTKFFSIYDRDNDRVGLGLANHSAIKTALN